LLFSTYGRKLQHDSNPILNPALQKCPTFLSSPMSFFLKTLGFIFRIPWSSNPTNPCQNAQIEKKIMLFHIIFFWPTIAKYPATCGDVSLWFYFKYLFLPTEQFLLGCIYIVSYRPNFFAKNHENQAGVPHFSSDKIPYLFHTQFEFFHTLLNCLTYV
jgi:hypothetical protein